jgi:hypothetical protein
MASPAIPVSSPALDQWRPQGDRLSYSDAAWCGAAFGVVMHASLHFFSVAIPVLERFLVVFAPAELFAFALTRNADPIATWLLLLASQALFWALVGVLMLAAVREAVELVRR